MTILFVPIRPSKRDEELEELEETGEQYVFRFLISLNHLRFIVHKCITNGYIVYVLD